MRNSVLALLLLPWICSCQQSPTVAQSPRASLSATPSATPARTFQRDRQTGQAALPALGKTPIALKAIWEPMVGLPQFMTEPEYGKTLSALRPESVRSYPSSSFLVFLPAKAVQLGAAFPIPSDSVPVGTVWALPGSAVAHFLKQFHPSATADILVDAPGAFAVLRARSQDRWEIDFRAHVQFELVPGVFMTPARFQGRLLVNLAQGKVEFAEFVVPSSGQGPGARPNVAMDAARGEGLAGVGRLPRMELVGGEPDLLLSTAWEDEMPAEEAQRVLAQQFYPFLEVEWSPLKVALARASIEHKPLLAIVIAGPLDDQSC